MCFLYVCVRYCFHTGIDDCFSYSRLFIMYVEGAFSIEVWGHRSAGFSRSKPGWEVEQQQLAKARSLADRWSELTRKIELWVEIQELNEQGEYSPVEVAVKQDTCTGENIYNYYACSIAEYRSTYLLLNNYYFCFLGGIYQLRQGQQRRIQVRVKPVQNSGTLPIICQSILNIAVGSVSVRNRLQIPLDSYQDEDLSILREKWSDALMRRRQYLDQQIQKLINKQGIEMLSRCKMYILYLIYKYFILLISFCRSHILFLFLHISVDKTEQDMEREQSLVDQWVSLTEERNAVLVPAAGSGIPGAPADWTPPAGMEPHIPVLFLDLNGIAKKKKKKNTLYTCACAYTQYMYQYVSFDLLTRLSRIIIQLMISQRINRERKCQ